MNSPVTEQLLDSFLNYAPVRVPISDLIKTLSGSCDYGDEGPWLMGIFNMKLADNEMGWLIDSVLENGLVTPLNVIRKWDGEFEMGNGHHRLVAALLCGIEEIDVVVTSGIDWTCSSDDDMEYEYDVYEAYDVWYPILWEIKAEIGSLLIG